MNDDKLLEQIKHDLPSLDEEILTMWLLPFAKNLGWPPNISSDWMNRLYGQKINFWRGAGWKKTKIDLSNIQLTRRAKSQIRNMERVYIDNDRNSFFYAALQGDKKNFANIAAYIYQNGDFPKPPILMRSYYDENQYELVDGNRRMTAYFWVKKMYAFSRTPDYTKQSQIDLTGITNPDDNQDIWLCEPDWSSCTPDYRIEEYIYDMFD